MSEIEERGAAPAGGPPAVSGDVLVDHLRRRGAHPAPRTLAASISARIADTEPERRWRLAVRAWQPRLATLALGSTLVLVAGVLFWGGGSTPPAANSPTTWDPKNGPMTVEQLAAVMGRWVPENAGHVVIVDATLLAGTTHRGDPCVIPGLSSMLAGAYRCVLGELATASPAINVSGYVPFVGGVPEFPPSPGPIMALRLDSPGEVTLIATLPGDGRPRSVRESLAADSIGVVKGWLSGQGAVPCPARPPSGDLTWDQQPTVFDGCPIAALADRAASSATLDISAPDVLQLQGGAYLDFAPSPSPLDDSGNQAPREGTYVVLGHPQRCAITPDASPDPRRCATFELAARLDPLPIPGGPSTPATPSPAVQGLTWDPRQRALTPPELLRILATRPDPGTILIVDDQIAGLLVSCASADHCPTGRLVNGGVDVEAPVGGHLPSPTDGGQVVDGPLALEVTSGPNLVFLGAMISNGLRMSFAAHDLLARDAMGGLFVIPAWLWGTPPAPCPSVPGTPVPMPTSELGLPAPRLPCVPTSWLTDSDTTDPGRGGGVGFPVQHGAYQTFAPPPVVPPLVPPIDNSTGSPQWAIYLVRDWAGYGEVLGRLQPLGIPDPFVPQSPTPVPSETSSGVVMSVDELVGGVLGGSLAPGAIAIADVPASAVTGYWDPGVVHDCPQSCPNWRLIAGTQWVAVDVFEGAPPVTTILGTQAFLVEDTGSIRALGSVSIGGTGGRPTVAPADGGLWVVQGWLRLGVTQAVPCPAPQRSTMTGLLGESLSWSGCPGAWIADSPFGASGPDGTVLTDEAPNGGLHVQDGAGDASFQPQLSAWLVRATVTGCPDGPACPATLTQKPPADVTWWELVGPIAGSISPPETSAPPTPVVPEVRPVPYSISVDEPAWNRLADPRGLATACFGASDCGSYDPWYPGVTRGPDVDLSQSFRLRLAGYVVVAATWDGSDLIVHVRARKGGYQEAVVSFPSGPVHAASVVVIDQAAGGFVVATIPIP